MNGYLNKNSMYYAIMKYIRFQWYSSLSRNFKGDRGKGERATFIGNIGRGSFSGNRNSIDSDRVVSGTTWTMLMGQFCGERRSADGISIATKAVAIETRVVSVVSKAVATEKLLTGLV